MAKLLELRCPVAKRNLSLSKAYTNLRDLTPLKQAMSKHTERWVALLSVLRVADKGQGTQAGDPIEAFSLSKIFSDGRKDQALMVGSIKSNIGHLEGGSGIAGVVKTVLMLEKNLILPNFNFAKANPWIPMKDWKIKVCTPVPCTGNGEVRVTI